ncbi:toxin-antitoxin system HicB family antitoxin [Agrobacterium rosae]|uniref:toxin-antitoxin system HicB family antitoxin n=1 Tax=Agrobacterium rosae TaxID=1972867 RepID=UPI00097DA68D|nr:toxin-antitoxin system HicB family antitoxin [Agrobacterium rosae]
MKRLRQAIKWLHYEVMRKSDDPETKIANIAPFGLRLQPELKRRVEAAAKKANRSLNAEITSRLEFSFAADVIVQETGWDVGHGHETPEFAAAHQKTKTLEKRVEELEAKVAALMRAK